MSNENASEVGRYDRQIAFAPLGRTGQRRLREGSALIIGVGGLGCVTAELLARAGVGRLRLVDDDVVHLENLHRQVLYDEGDAAAGAPKAEAAMRRLHEINSDVCVEAVVARLDADNAEDLARGLDVIIDGTDNFATRFIINDLAVRDGAPWIFAGGVGGEAQTMTIVPGRSPCLRCVFDSPPPTCVDPNCRTGGIIGPTVVAVAAMQSAEAMKILSGRAEDASTFLTKFDLWGNTIQRIDIAEACRDVDCPCCKLRDFEFLSGGH